MNTTELMWLDGNVVGLYTPPKDEPNPHLEFGRQSTVSHIVYQDIPEGGNMTRWETFILLGALTVTSYAHKPLVVVELGVLSGGTSRAINWWLTKTGVDYQFIGIDSWQGGGPEAKTAWWRRNGEYVDKGVCRMVEGKFETVYVPRVIHVLFIDGHHAREAVLHDFLRFSPAVPVGGCVIFHDIVTTTGPPQDYPTGGVKEALEELRLENNGWSKRGWFERFPADTGGGLGIFVRL